MSCVVLQLNNLKKINKGILDYYDKVLHLSLDSFSHPDLSRIGQVPILPYSHSAMFSFTCAPIPPFLLQLMKEVRWTWLGSFN